MSAKLVTFPHREKVYHPDFGNAWELIDMVEGDFGKLLGLASLSLQSIRSRMDCKDDSPESCQAVMNALGLAFLSLATMIGIPRGEIEDGPPPAG